MRRRRATRAQLQASIIDLLDRRNRLERELDGYRRLELILLAVDVEPHEHGPIVRKTVLMRQPAGELVRQAERAMPPGGAVSLWAVDGPLELVPAGRSIDLLVRLGPA